MPKRSEKLLLLYCDLKNTWKIVVKVLQNKIVNVKIKYAIQMTGSLILGSNVPVFLFKHLKMWCVAAVLNLVNFK